MAYTKKRSAKINARRTRRERGSTYKQLYTLDVFIIGGPVTKDFGKRMKT
jgi:hypothetical protein